MPNFAAILCRVAMTMAGAAPWAMAQQPQPPQSAPAAPAEVPGTAAEQRPWVDVALARKCGEAADRGLDWLAARQTAAGTWVGLVGHKMNDDYVLLDAGMSLERQRSNGHGHLGVAALCGMAFLAGGNLPDRGKHAAVITRTYDYIAARGQESGLLSDAGTRMYSHAFATLFLAEIAGMVETDLARGPLERAVTLIVDSQNAHGGWRYNPFDRETDLSVTVCQLQALRAARNIGIRVPSETIERAMSYVSRSRVPRGRSAGHFYYKIYDRGAYEKADEYAINAAALTALSSAGVHDAELSDPVLTFLAKDYGGIADYYRDHYYFWYGNYYAAQAFYQHGGERLRAFFERLARDLLAAQRPDGSWENRVGPGDEFATAVACILLQMPKQYLPIFQR
ncbi:MAG: hypothetical protein RL398_1377 [Planctomycetota bacterium]